MEQGIDWDLSGVPDDGLLPEISRRFTGVCCGVAAALVDEGVASIEDTDRGAKIGLRWALGPFELMNRIGLGTALEAVRSVCDRYEDFSMPVMLEKQAAAGSPFQFKVVELLVHEGIGWITINRPEAMNALNEAVITQLDQVLSQALEDNQVQAIAIQGAGKAFVAGADIKFFIDRIKGGRVSEIVDFTRKGHGVLLKIETASKPTIAILDGLSLGGGSELALAAHYRIVTDAGSMGFPETGIGIYPGLGGMLRFSRFAGPELARYYTFTGARLTAQELVDLGIATKQVSPEEIPGVVGELAYSELSPKYKKISLPERFQKLADACSKENVTRLLNGGILEADSSVSEALVKVTGYKAPLAMKMADEIIEAQEGKAIPEAIEIELGRLNEIFTTGDALEGLTSAGRKRPQFKGI